MRDLRVIIVIDNFRIGGIQRLALDQLCALSDMGIPAEIHYRQLQATAENPNFLDLESKRISQKALKILPMPSSRVMQLLHFANLFWSRRFTLVLNLSVGATVILRLAKLMTFSFTPIYTSIQQLPSLSAPVQRWKRFVYASFSNRLYCGSNAFVLDWNERLCKNLLSRVTLGVNLPNLIRNGVYLGRLPTRATSAGTIQNSNRVVFIGRNVAWKNSELVVSLLRARDNHNLSALIVVPSISDKTVSELKTEFGSRIQFEIGKKIEDIVFEVGDINIYPVNYGPHARYIESISINCLEMACLGIPSLVTCGGCSTWPELLEMGFFYEVDWSCSKCVKLALESAKSFNPNENLIKRAQQLVSVENMFKSLFQP